MRAAADRMAGRALGRTSSPLPVGKTPPGTDLNSPSESGSPTGLTPWLRSEHRLVALEFCFDQSFAAGEVRQLLLQVVCACRRYRGFDRRDRSVDRWRFEDGAEPGQHW